MKKPLIVGDKICFISSSEFLDDLVFKNLIHKNGFITEVIPIFGEEYEVVVKFDNFSIMGKTHIQCKISSVKKFKEPIQRAWDR